MRPGWVLYICTALVALGLWPARVTSPVTTEPPIKLAPVQNRGALVVVPHQGRMLRVLLNGRILSFWPEKQIWFGVIPLGADRWHLSGIMKSRPSVTLALPFTHLGNFAPTESTPAPSIWSLAGSITREEVAPVANLRLPTSVRQQMAAASAEQLEMDRETLRQLLSRSQANLRADCWQIPLRSRITSPFGRARQLPSGEIYEHTGEDRRAAVGTPIHAAGPGQIIFVGKKVVAGNSILVDHGAGLFSRYLHLSQMFVSPGQIVRTGERIGATGDTGRVEAPHLHWEVIWRGVHADPSAFVRDWNQLCPEKVAPGEPLSDRESDEWT